MSKFDDLNAKRVARQAEAGFTLIEILLVVVIIGILAAVAVPKLSGRVRQAKQNAAASSIGSIGLAINMYEVDNGKYPDSLQNLVTKGSEDNWNGPYLEKGVPKDPWGHDFQYSKNGNQYTLSSAGPDGSFGTEDDVK
ncbi:MAG: type II secretion system major pseudopilin GspG [Kiritimatiellae bacterium]|nr:type II secretion system major pseudopilin GspG [Kiritimatiellia bacterium]